MHAPQTVNWDLEGRARNEKKSGVPKDKHLSVSNEAEAFLASHMEVAALISQAIPALNMHYMALGKPITLRVDLFSDPEVGGQRISIKLYGTASARDLSRALRDFGKNWWTEARSAYRDFFDFQVGLA